MMNWWCKKGVDGFRMDVISLISKQPGLPDGVAGETGYADSGSANGPHVHEYLQEMNRRVLSHYDLITVGEAAIVRMERHFIQMADRAGGKGMEQPVSG